MSCLLNFGAWKLSRAARQNEVVVSAWIYAGGAMCREMCPAERKAGKVGKASTVRLSWSACRLQRARLVSGWVTRGAPAAEVTG
jgi:hypothetical protein